MVLWLASLAIIATVAVMLAMGAMEVAAPPLEAPEADGRVRMINPRFSGRDSGGKPYVITADSAVRRNDDPQIIDLDKPHLDLLISTSETGSIVIADTGAYDSRRRTLELYGDVQLETETGYSFGTTHARVLADQARIEGDEPVEGSGPLGDIRSQKFIIEGWGERVLFTDGSSSHIYQRKKAPVQPPPEDDVP